MVFHRLSRYPSGVGAAVAASRPAHASLFRTKQSAEVRTPLKNQTKPVLTVAKEEKKKKRNITYSKVIVPKQAGLRGPRLKLGLVC